MDDLKPTNIGNAKTVNEICSPILQLSMLRFEAIFDFYSEEPSSINVQLNQGEQKHKLEQILRIRKWGNNAKSYSWSIYSQQREWNENATNDFGIDNNLIVRQVIWDMKVDADKSKNCSPIANQHLIDLWPSIYTKNFYIDSKESSELINQISDFDKLMEHGISLNSNNSPSWNWKDLEVMRLFDWGQIHTTWSPIKGNVDIEKKIDEFDEYLIIGRSTCEIHSLDLDYSINPEMFKKIITGKM